MSGTTPLKDQLVHNNLAHKLMHHCLGDLHLDAGIRSSKKETYLNLLVEVLPEGFSVTKEGAAFIIVNLPDDVLSHRERKIMKDMTRPAPKALTAAEIAPELVNPDPNLSLAGLF